MLERLYAPSLKDLATGQYNVRRYLEVVTTAGAATSLAVTGQTVPNDIIRLVHTITFSMFPGAAQTPVGAACLLIANEPGFPQLAILGASPPSVPTAAAAMHMTLSSLELCMMYNEAPQVSALFNAGVASNSVFMYLMGWEFQRGTVQR